MTTLLTGVAACHRSRYRVVVAGDVLLQLRRALRLLRMTMAM
jgi:hypothetical protein